MAQATDNSLPVIIVGGGPAGMMAGVLLARAGIAVTVLEKHADFLRDFRGDTVHPSTLELFHQLGWLEDLLQLPHSRIDEVGLRIAGSFCKLVDFGHLPVAAPYIAMMPQWDLLDFLAGKGAELPGFSLRMNTEATDLLEDENGRVCGVKLADGKEMTGRLVIAADGRRSVLRGSACLPLQVLGAPMDVFWFRLSKPAGLHKETFGSMQAGRFLILIDRRDYFQCAYILRKGQAGMLRAQGIAAFRDIISSLVPELAPAVDELQDWKQVKLLDVALDRLEQWERPGLLVIGDAAHAMSPIGGVGINVAVQDAVAAANLLVRPLLDGANPDPLLSSVRKRRWKAVTRMQAFQKFAQDRVIEPLLARTKHIEKPFWPMRLLDRLRILRRIPARVIGMGFDRVVIEAPEILAPHYHNNPASGGVQA